MSLLPVELACRLAALPEERRWLIDGLWSEEAVGIVGGEPKCCKSFLALDIAVSVAAGTPCLRRFSVPRPGRVLLFAAEDALHVVRCRIEGIAHAAQQELAALDIHVITAPSLRLDLDDHQQRLTETIDSLRPKLLVLDPFVRLHRRNENAADEISPMLAFLRDLQRRFSLAVVVVHHARKSAGGARDGQALRGSSDFHAWGDSNLYLRRTGDALTLAIEHRAAPSTSGIPLALTERGPALALEVLERAPCAPSTTPPSLTARIEHALADAALPLPFEHLRRVCRVRTASLSDALANMRQQGRVTKSSAGYALTET